jgi:hypothetical protein
MSKRACQLSPIVLLSLEMEKNSKYTGRVGYSEVKLSQQNPELPYMMSSIFSLWLLCLQLAILSFSSFQLV